VILDTFKPVVYREGLGRVTSPPFDMLSIALENELKKNKYNIINLKECKDPENAKIMFNEWIDKGIITQFNNESFVVLKQSFEVDNVYHERYGVIGTINLRLDENCLIPHEDTLIELVREREKLIERMEYQTEPVFVVTDKCNINETLRDIVIKRNCDKTYEEPEGVKNSICIVSGAEDIEKIKATLKGSIGIIADGHHRTKALLSLCKKYGNETPFFRNLFVFVTSLKSDGIFIGQVHRIVDYYEDIIQNVKSNFKLEPTKDYQDNNVPILLHGNERFRILLKKDCTYSDYLKGIETAISSNNGKINIFYTYRIQEAISISKEKGKIGFIMPPWKKEDFSLVVKNGTILPAKSTYFYPKIPSGITFYGNEVEECHCGSVGRAADS
jgi:uncharacterized protein (DUF1015 family)